MPGFFIPYNSTPRNMPITLLPESLKQEIISKHLKKFIANTVRSYQRVYPYLSSEDLKDIQQEALIFFIENLNFFDYARFNQMPDSIVRRLPIDICVLNMINDRLNFARCTYKESHQRKEGAFENFKNLSIQQAVLEQETECCSSLATRSLDLDIKLKQIFPKLTNPRNNLQENYEYLSFLNKDYFKFTNSEQVISFLDKMYNLKPKMKKLIEEEIFTKGKIHLFRSINFLNQLHISYDAQIKILPYLSTAFITSTENLITIFNLFSEERIVKLLATNNPESGKRIQEDNYIQDIASMVGKIDYLLIRKVIPDVESFSSYIQTYPQMLINKPKDIKEIHDWLSTIYSNIALIVKENAVLPYIKELDGVLFDGYESFVPRTELDLITIGNSMGICVGSYAQNVLLGHSFIVVLKEKDKFNICIDLNVDALAQKEIEFRQIKYAHNNSVPKKISDEIKKNLQILFTGTNQS